MSDEGRRLTSALVRQFSKNRVVFLASVLFTRSTFLTVVEIKYDVLQHYIRELRGCETGYRSVETAVSMCI